MAELRTPNPQVRTKLFRVYTYLLSQKSSFSTTRPRLFQSSWRKDQYNILYNQAIAAALGYSLYPADLDILNSVIKPTEFKYGNGNSTGVTASSITEAFKTTLNDDSP